MFCHQEEPLFKVFLDKCFEITFGCLKKGFIQLQFLKWLSYIVMLSQSRQMHVDSNRMNKFIGSKLQKKLERENKTN